MKNIYYTLTSKIYYLIIIGIIGFGISAELFDYFQNQYDAIPNYYEIILVQLNDEHKILFNLMFCLLIFADTQSKSFTIIESKMEISTLKKAIYISLFFIVFLLIGNLIYGISNFNLDILLGNRWSDVSVYSKLGMKPVETMNLSVLLFTLRCVFCLYITNTFIEIVKNKAYGVWAILLISCIDFCFYRYFRINIPRYILPLEHTKILCSKAFDTPTEYLVRVPYIQSIMYWIMLIIFVYIFGKIARGVRGVQNEKNFS